MELTEKQRYWQGHLEAAESFAGPLTEYAHLHDLDVKKLYVFKGVLRDKLALDTVNESHSFVQVTTQTTTRSTAIDSTVRVVLPNGVNLSLPSLAQPGLLERLAKL